MQKVLIAGVLLLSLASPSLSVRAQDTPVVTPEADPEVTRLLTEYAQAIANLPPLPNLQFRQQVQVTGEQDYAATLDVLYREDGSWQTWLAEGDRVRLLDSRRAAFSSGNDLLQLYSTYVDQADSLILEGTLRLDAAAGSYPEATVEDAVVNDQTVHHIVLNNTTGQVRELWLDPDTFLPVQALLQIRDRWGNAFALVQYAAFEDLWLPQRLDINLAYGFWTMQGLRRRTFQGELAIRHDYQNYLRLDSVPFGSAPLSFDPQRPPTGVEPAALATTEVGEINQIGLDADGNLQFDVGLRGSGTTSPLEQRINAFNAARPGFRNALTQFDTLVNLRWGVATLPVYLLRFDAGTSLLPFEAGNTEAEGEGLNRINPFDPTDARQPFLQLYQIEF